MWGEPNILGNVQWIDRFLHVPSSAVRMGGRGMPCGGRTSWHALCLRRATDRPFYPHFCPTLWSFWSHPSDFGRLAHHLVSLSHTPITQIRLCSRSSIWNWHRAHDGSSRQAFNLKIFSLIESTKGNGMECRIFEPYSNLDVKETNGSQNFDFLKLSLSHGFIMRFDCPQWSFMILNYLQMIIKYFQGFSRILYYT